MSSFVTSLTKLGTIGCLLAFTIPTLAETPPTPPSENSVDVIVVEGVCEEGFFPVECSSGLAAVHFNAFPVVAALDDGFGPFSESNLCLPGFPSPEGINCEVVEELIGGEEIVESVTWSLGPPPACEDDVLCPPEPEIIPEAIRSVILSRCDEGIDGIAYNYVYGPLGLSADLGLRLFLPEFDGEETFYEQARPFDVTFCFGDPDAALLDPELSAAPPVPSCDLTTACPGGTTGNETFLVEVTKLRGADGEILQPQISLDDETCVCGPIDDAEVGLQQCDPSAGEGAPNACRDAGAGGPGQVTRIDQQNGDPYFCRTVNGTRRCWAY